MANLKRKMILGAVIFLAAAQAATAQAIVITNPLSASSTSPTGGKTLDQLFTSIMGFLFWLAIVICPVLIVWGAFQIATAADDENKVTTGKTFIKSAVIGFLVIALANVIKAVILDIVNVH